MQKKVETEQNWFLNNRSIMNGLTFKHHLMFNGKGQSLQFMGRNKRRAQKKKKTVERKMERIENVHLEK